MGNHQRTLFSSCFTSTRKRTLRVSAMYYEVEKIIDKKLVAEKKGQKRVWYFVKFKGYPPEANEWVSAKHSRMERLVREFHAAQKAATVLILHPLLPHPCLTPTFQGRKIRKKGRSRKKMCLGVANAMCANRKDIGPNFVNKLFNFFTFYYIFL
ncbi:uncharacterized protein LOC116928381 isoform X1 [Daphnia magna]|uniref:uncharacterized protein LOC116928381 isoform X1 n=1 Tax=Daphnia magna TaxID=35525 RepID=UPI001E1BC89F|nr:uncharacterized protein LOC116928381 isoform X1 [Daphnia magna]